MERNIGTFYFLFFRELIFTGFYDDTTLKMVLNYVCILTHSHIQRGGELFIFFNREFKQLQREIIHGQTTRKKQEEKQKKEQRKEKKNDA